MMEKVILLFCLAIVTVWFGIRFYSKNNEQIEDKADIKVIKNEINIIEAGGEEFLVSSMRGKAREVKKTSKKDTKLIKTMQ